MYKILLLDGHKTGLVWSCYTMGDKALNSHQLVLTLFYTFLKLILYISVSKCAFLRENCCVPFCMGFIRLAAHNYCLFLDCSVLGNKNILF